MSFKLEIFKLVLRNIKHYNEDDDRVMKAKCSLLKILKRMIKQKKEFSDNKLVELILAVIKEEMPWEKIKGLKEIL